ncbi:MAG: PAS domain S-box protein [Bacteroidales bacterium]|nr:PAS domain S-box protein [Bacteroidales bacterium]
MAFVFRKWISLPLLKSNNELKYSEERFRQVSESTGEWIWEVNADGLFTYCNATTMNIIGFQSEELVMKKQFFDLFVPLISEKKSRI